AFGDLADQAVFEDGEQDLGRGVCGEAGHGDQYILYRTYTPDSPVRLGCGSPGGAGDAFLVGAEDVDAAIDHDLGRVDAAAVEGLALGEERVGEGVFPAEVVP